MSSIVACLTCTSRDAPGAGYKLPTLSPKTLAGQHPKELRYATVVIFGVNVMFMLFLPSLSWLLNDKLGYMATACGKTALRASTPSPSVELLAVFSNTDDKAKAQADMCYTPANEIRCGSGRDYVEIAKENNRDFCEAGLCTKGIDEVGKQCKDEVGWTCQNRGSSFVCTNCKETEVRYYGFGCKEGMLGDWACAVNQPRFSLSYFISTGPGLGMFAVLSIFPILTMWMYGHGNADVRTRVLMAAGLSLSGELNKWSDRIRWSLLAFQIAFGLFLINLVCVNPELHRIIVLVFLGALIAHLAFMGLAVGTATQGGKTIKILSWVGVACVVVGYLIPESPSQFGQYAFFLGESVGLSCAFAITTTIIWFNL